MAKATGALGRKSRPIAKGARDTDHSGLRQRSGSPEKPFGSEPQPGTGWTFLSNHSHVLLLVSQEGSIVLREVAARVGITERAVQRIIRDLEQAGYLRKERVGRKNQYQVVPGKPLRHPIEMHRSIGDLLELVRKD